MHSKKALIFIAFILSFSLLITVYSSKANANFIDDVVSGAKKLLNSSDTNKEGEIEIESNISLAPNGDKDGDGKVSSGDEVRFSYIIKNHSGENYTFATLKTNIDRRNINFIHNIHATSLDDNGKDISFPNVRIRANQSTVFSFDTRINYFTDADKLISTEPELLSKEKKSVTKALRKEIRAHKIDLNKIPSLMKFKRNEVDDNVHSAQEKEERESDEVDHHNPRHNALIHNQHQIKLDQNEYFLFHQSKLHPSFHSLKNLAQYLLREPAH